MKKVITLLLITIFIPFSVTIVSARDVAAYVVMGDDVAEGGSGVFYQERFAGVLRKKHGQIEVVAERGMTSLDLSKKITTREYVFWYDYVGILCISIGGNDLMQAFSSQLSEAFDMQNAEPYKLRNKVSDAIYNNNFSYLLKINTAMKKLIEDLPALSAKYEKNLNKIIDTIRSENTRAKIILLNLYNPYKNMPFFSNYFETACESFNKIIQKNSGENRYEVADVYTAFNNSSEILINNDNKRDILEPHPNVKGHTVIAECLSPYYPINWYYSDNNDDSEIEADIIPPVPTKKNINIPIAVWISTAAVIGLAIIIIGLIIYKKRGNKKCTKI